jgi:large subunit ribosomal protein L23
MREERLLKILLAPQVSEKTTTLAEASHQVATFKVVRDATKPEIKEAVERLFNVKVRSVTVANVKGKRKRFGAIRGKRADWKKAYVRLEAGHRIGLFGAE